MYNTWSQHALQDMLHYNTVETYTSAFHIVSKLSLRITKLESEKKSLKTELEDSRLCQAALQQKFETLLAQEDKKIPIEEHLTIMDECRR